MGSGAVNIVLEQFHILENGVVDSLKHVIFGAVGLHQKGVVDKAVPKGFDLLYIALNGKKFYNFKWFHLNDSVIYAKLMNFCIRNTPRFGKRFKGFRSNYEAPGFRSPTHIVMPMQWSPTGLFSAFYTIIWDYR